MMQKLSQNLVPNTLFQQKEPGFLEKLLTVGLREEIEKRSLGDLTDQKGSAKIKIKKKKPRVMGLCQRRLE